jgi:putative CocE/NonD family hydrolase
MKHIISSLTAAFLTLILTACGGASGGGSDSSIDSNSVTNANDNSGWVASAYEREENYPNISKTSGSIEMRDGVKLAYSVAVPADENGNPVEGPFPTVLTQTGYNTGLSAVSSLNPYLVKRGYAHVSVDVRGTGASGGNWDAFGEEAQADHGEVISWTADQEFCDGNIGSWGASFLAITQFFTAAHEHPAHKAIFAIVPMADAYRDIVYTGGQFSAAFVPFWLGLVTGLTIVPSANTFDDPESAFLYLVNDVINAGTGFQTPTFIDIATGNGATQYDGEFWRLRSPIEYSDRINIPSFIVGGLNDIFQRGEPMLYEALKNNATTKLLIGPWTHVAGAEGAGLPLDGVPDINQLAVQWFDQYLMGIDSGASSVPNVTQYLYGADKYVTSQDWPHPQARAERWFLREGGALTKEMPADGETGTKVLQLPVNGICSSSTDQYTLGFLTQASVPCFQDNAVNEAALEVTFTTDPMTEDYYINGPIGADIWVSPDMAMDVGVSVKVTLVGADGSSKEITNGLLSARHRAVDASKSRFLDGQNIQPWHPFTEEALSPAPGIGEPILLNIEVFPTSFVVPAGSSLRLAIGASDFPHGLPPLTDLADQVLGVYSLLTDAEHPSSVVVPTVPLSTIK